MPFINTITTTKIDKAEQQTLTQKYGKAIELIRGKTESWLMLKFEGEAKMAFRGDCRADCAMVGVDLYGNASDEDLDAFTAQITKILNETLNIPTDRVYVRYFSTPFWGYDGTNI